MRGRSLIGVLLWLVVAPAMAGGIYKCGSGASTSYSDQPCAAGPEVRVALPAAPPPSAVRDARDHLERQLAHARSRGNAGRADAAATPIDCRPELPKLGAARRLTLIEP